MTICKYKGSFFDVIGSSAHYLNIKIAGLGIIRSILVRVSRANGNFGVCMVIGRIANNSEPVTVFIFS